MATPDWRTQRLPRPPRADSAVFSTMLAPPPPTSGESLDKTALEITGRERYLTSLGPAPNTQPDPCKSMLSYQLCGVVL